MANKNVTLKDNNSNSLFPKTFDYNVFNSNNESLDNVLATKSAKDASNLTDANILNWQNKLNNMTTPSVGGTISGKQAVVVQSYVSSNRRICYRVWSDGWKEIYMCLEGSASTTRIITLPIAFTRHYIFTQGTISYPTTSSGTVIYNQLYVYPVDLQTVHVAPFGALEVNVTLCGY